MLGPLRSVLGWAIGVWPISAATREHQAALHKATCRFQRYDVEIAVTLSHERCASDHNFWGMRVYHATSLFGRFNPKVVAMLAEFLCCGWKRNDGSRKTSRRQARPTGHRSVRRASSLSKKRPGSGRISRRRASCQTGPVTEEPGRPELVQMTLEGGQTL